MPHLTAALLVAAALTGCGSDGGRSLADPPAAPKPAGSPGSPEPAARSQETPPALAGYPNADSTGVPTGTRLTVVTGDQTISADNLVITGKDFHGFVTVTGSNVTFRDCVFRGRATDRNAALLDTERGRNTVVVSSDFAPSHPSATVDDLWTKSTRIYRADIRGGVDGVKANSHTLIQDSYIHDLTWFDRDPNQNGGPTHNDGVQSFAGERDVTLRHNTIDMSTTKQANAALQTSAHDTRVLNNLLDGGACVLNFDHTVLNGPLTGIEVAGNRFGRHSAYDCPILLSTRSIMTRNEGNVWDDTGRPIPPPERHD
ncbi:hypothetical protein Aple_087720 [Acrocarpospora pleiomorpha]|uniref:Right handed beta helix domain-containing protein n=1 Tax=Acrocarpospora pleiomorpha TaxID=90975 RepID=A0A5M3Y2B2_9ACTN|nr:hypothetical protein [Acrocarpospora pleiomorpha]GES25873.1 hypothetical protein Aple_087720 [Acrocarpospora pleiomorpha]